MATLNTVPPGASTTTVPKVVVASDLSRRYGEGDAQVDALKDVSVDFGRGTFSAVMGPSGSGKSTLMHILAGLDRPTSGSVSIDGADITRMGDKPLTLLRRKKIGFVFQFFNLLPMLTAEENILLPIKIGGEKVDPGLFNTIVETVRIKDRLNHRPSELSGGQQQRVAIARALVTNPAVVFADEPTGNLDSASTADVLNLLRHAVDDMGNTIIMVTHAPDAAAVSDRILFLADGKIVRDQPSSTVDEILDVMKVIR
jgi:putative ABC transport system ATP-binding protein